LDDLQDTGDSPGQEVFASMSVAISFVGAAIGQQNLIMQRQANSIDKAVAVSEKKARIEALKLQLWVNVMCIVLFQLCL